MIHIVYLSPFLFIHSTDLKRKEKGWTSFGRIVDEKMRADIDATAEKLEGRRERLCEHQWLLFPILQDHLCDTSTVYIPSAIPTAIHSRLGLEAISNLEVECRTRLAVKCVVNLQEAIRNLDALGQYKDLNDRGQEQNTESSRIMTSYKRMRDVLIEDYGRHRAALIALEALPPGSSDLPPLTLKDTWRKNTTSTYCLGNSRRRDAALWTAGGFSALIEGKERVEGMEGDEDVYGEGSASAGGVTEASVSVQTQMSRRKRQKVAKPNGPRPVEKSSPKKQSVSQANGWIWEGNVVLGQTEDEWAKERESVLLLNVRCCPHSHLQKSG